MKIERLFEDDWQGVISKDKEYKCISIDQIIAAIDKLNGENKTLIELIIDDDNFLTLAGGNEGRYICYITQNGSIYNLINTDYIRNDKTVLIVAGGQQGDFSARLCVKYDQTTKAAISYYQNGQKDPDLFWESA